MSIADSIVRTTPRFGMLAYLGAAISLGFCFSKGLLLLLQPVFGVSAPDMNPHVQAIFMWLFAAGSVVALWFDKREHEDDLPVMIGAGALVVIVGTLYTYYQDFILMLGYVLLVVAAFLNQNRMLSSLNRTVAQQANELAELNSSLEQRVEAQVGEIERLARLKRFLPGEVANLVTSEGNEDLLKSHRRYIACLFCDIRRFTSMTEAMEPEDVMDVLRSFHEAVGKLVSQHRGTIGFRAGDGVLVFFNDPIRCDDPDLRAVRLALDIRTAFDDLKQRWSRLDADVGLGVGIASGYATMGIIGVEGRFDYTPIGGAVNLAARLSDHAEDGEILLSRRTRAELDERVKSIARDDIKLKGIQQPVEVHALSGRDAGMQ